MEITINQAKISGEIRAIESKSFAHRALICAAFSDRPTEIICAELSEDILATADVLTALGAKITIDTGKLWVEPVGEIPKKAILNCRESGSTYRFILPCVCIKGASARFKLEGRLPQRPMDVFWDLVESHGVTVRGKGRDIVCVSGELSGDKLAIPGNISSQYISGLIMALGMSGKYGEIEITNGIESLGYINITLDVVNKFGIRAEFAGNKIKVYGEKRYKSPGTIKIEGDWSNASFWLCTAAACECDFTVNDINTSSVQGDRAVCSLLEKFGATLEYGDDFVKVKKREGRLEAINIDAHNIPDLIPAIALAAIAAKGETVIYGARRLRLKESDRIKSITEAITALGGKAVANDDGMVITGAPLSGGVVDSFGDHRIAMLAACASTMCENPVTIKGFEAVKKSYPDFYKDFQKVTER